MDINKNVSISANKGVPGLILATVTFVMSWKRSLDTIRVIRSRRLRWAVHVARLEEGRSVFKILTDRPTGKRP